MTITTKEARKRYNQSAEKIGMWYIHHRSGGGVNFWKTGMRPRGFDIPKKDKIISKYQRDVEEKGTVSNTTQTYLGFYGILACGKRSQVEGRRALGLPVRKTGSEQKARSTVFRYWRPRKTTQSYKPTRNTEKRV